MIILIIKIIKIMQNERHFDIHKIANSFSTAFNAEVT